MALWPALYLRSGCVSCSLPCCVGDGRALPQLLLVPWCCARSAACDDPIAFGALRWVPLPCCLPGCWPVPCSMHGTCWTDRSAALLWLACPGSLAPMGHVVHWSMALPPGAVEMDATDGNGALLGFEARGHCASRSC